MTKPSRRRFKFPNILWQFPYFRWKTVMYSKTHIKGTLLLNSQIWRMLIKSELFQVLILCISEFIQNWFLLLTTKSRRENIYCEISGKIFNILKNYLHESLIPTPMTILIILLCSLKILLLHGEFHQKIIP